MLIISRLGWIIIDCPIICYYPNLHNKQIGISSWMINDSVNIIYIECLQAHYSNTRHTGHLVNNSFPKGFAIRPSWTWRYRLQNTSNSVDLRKYLFLLSNNIPKVLGVPNREFRLAKGKRQASKPRFTRGKTFWISGPSVEKGKTFTVS